ncbi:Nicotianamine synthase 9, partial [Dichanthelium oligosanthes]
MVDMGNKEEEVEVQAQLQAEEEEEEEALVQKIAGLTAAIAKLPSLSPSPEVNALFTELVTACIPPSTVDVEQLGPELQEMRARLIRLCADAEALLEAHYSDLLAAFDNPLDHLAIFPYFNNYILLSQLEHGLLAHHVPGPAPARVAFVGSGPLPLSSLVLAARHLPAASFDNYDICGEANDRARRLVRADGDLTARMAFRTSDVAHVTRDLASYDVVFLAALVGMAAEEKARVVEHLGRHMAPGAALVVRSAHGARGFLYPVVDPEEIRRGGFDVLAVHHPEGEVINSVIIARKPVPVDAQAANGVGAAHAHAH